MANINPYLNFNGNTEEAFNFYKYVFGGEFVAVHRFKDMEQTANVPPADQNKIMHIALPIGNGNMLMATDTLESAGHSVTVGTNFSIAINPDSEQQGRHWFEKLSAGGQVSVPYDKSPWGSYFGMLTDKYGIQWMVDYAINQKQ